MMLVHRLAWVMPLVPLVLAACLLAPGKFTADLTIRADRSFSFAYKGEVIAVDPSQDMGGGLAPASNDKAADAAEKAKKRADAETRHRAMAAALAKEAGYRSVSYVGDGKFLIDYAASGVLTTGFVFPFNTDAEVVFPFLAIEVRKDGSVRMKAPGFGAESSKPGAPEMPGSDSRAEGVLTLTTDAEVVMHNVEEGAAEAGAMKTLVWRVTPLTKSAPVAVLRMKTPLP